MKSSDGESRTTASYTGQMPLALPVGLALDAQSRLFVSDARVPQVVVFSPCGEPVIALGTKLMKQPAGLAVDDQRGRLYVADILLRKVLVYNLKTLRLVRQIGGPIPPAEPTPDTLSAPANLALARDGRLFVSDTLQRRVVVFNRKGEFVRAVGQTGRATADFARRSRKNIVSDSEGQTRGPDAAFSNLILAAYWQLLISAASGGEMPGRSMQPGRVSDTESRLRTADHRTPVRDSPPTCRQLPAAIEPAAVARRADGRSTP